MQASLVASGGFLSVTMDPALFESPATDNFLVHFFLDNPLPDPVWIDARDYWGLIRPVQYTGSEEPGLQVVDISFQEPPEVTDSLEEEVLAAADAGSLLEIGGYGRLDYYVDFNAAGRGEIDALDTPWLVLAIGGWLTVTDGQSVEVVCPAEGPIFVPVQLPATWSRVPDRSLLAFDSGSGPRIKRTGLNY